MGNVALISLHAGFPCLSLCRDTAFTNKIHIYVPRPDDQSHTVHEHAGNALRQRGCMRLPRRKFTLKTSAGNMGWMWAILRAALWKPPGRWQKEHWIANQITQQSSIVKYSNQCRITEWRCSLSEVIWLFGRDLEANIKWHSQAILLSECDVFMSEMCIEWDRDWFYPLAIDWIVNNTELRRFITFQKHHQHLLRKPFDRDMEAEGQVHPWQPFIVSMLVFVFQITSLSNPFSFVIELFAAQSHGRKNVSMS